MVGLAQVVRAVYAATVRTVPGVPFSLPDIVSVRAAPFEGPEGPEEPEGPVGPEGPEETVGPEGLEGPEGPERPEGPEGPFLIIKTNNKLHRRKSTARQKEYRWRTPKYILDRNW